jgi:hypothetical protein
VQNVTISLGFSSETMLLIDWLSVKEVGYNLVCDGTVLQISANGNSELSSTDTSTQPPYTTPALAS